MQKCAVREVLFLALVGISLFSLKSSQAYELGKVGVFGTHCKAPRTKLTKHDEKADKGIELWLEDSEVTIENITKPPRATCLLQIPLSHSKPWQIDKVSFELNTAVEGNEASKARLDIEVFEGPVSLGHSLKKAVWIAKEDFARRSFQISENENWSKLCSRDHMLRMNLGAFVPAQATKTLIRAPKTGAFVKIHLEPSECAF